MKKHWKETSTFRMLFGDTIVPACVPLSYRLYLLFLKGKRSLAGRAVRLRPVAFAPLEAIRTGEVVFGPVRLPLINKTVKTREDDFNNDQIRSVLEDLLALEQRLTQHGLRITSAAGTFKRKDYVPDKERNKRWENVWLLSVAQPGPDQVVLDLGGASTIFSFMLASKGCRTHVVDNDWGAQGLIYNARTVARRMRWPMRVYNRDLSRSLPFTDHFFDQVFCVCVLEHLAPAVRRHLMKEIHRVLKPGGTVSLTIDYDSGREDPHTDKGLRYGCPETLKRDILEPGGLEIAGNQVMTDDCPPEFFLGTLFLKKPR